MTKENEVYVKEVFLGGTIDGHDWRTPLTAKIEEAGWSVFNPIVENWDKLAQKTEEEKKETCRVCLFHVNKNMHGVFSIAEMVQMAILAPKRTVVHFSYDGFTERQIASFREVSKLIQGHGGTVLRNLDDLTEVLESISKYCRVRQNH